MAEWNYNMQYRQIHPFDPQQLVPETVQTKAHNEQMLRHAQEKWLMLEGQRKVDQSFLDGFVSSRINQKDESRVSKSLEERVIKRKEKRAWIQRKRERQIKETEEIQQKRLLLHQTIDNNLQQFQKENDTSRRHVDHSLRHVRRKQNEMKQIGKLVESLRQLRSLRERSIESRHALFSSQEDTRHFHQILDLVDIVVQKQSTEYEKEEETCRNQAEKSSGNVNYRKRWDRYVCQ